MADILRILSLSICLLAITGLVSGHPGHDHALEAAERSNYLKHHSRSLSHCAAKLSALGDQAANLKRRQALAMELRHTRGIDGHRFLKARDLNGVLTKDHRSKDTAITINTAVQDLFVDNTSCILQPEGTEGPYYVSNELVRKNITNGERGVPLHLDIQIVDTSTCEPVPAVYLDIWHCNATGVYGGVVADGNGNSGDSTNLKNSAFRGLQKTDQNGVVQFETLFPGHYTGRANHIHVLTHNQNATTLEQNNTVAGTVVSHAGQIFFDQGLVGLVEALAPYKSNTQPLTQNTDDAILGVEANLADPVLEYVLLGKSVTDGILGWISIGIDPTQAHVAYANNAYSGGEGAESGGTQSKGPENISARSSGSQSSGAQNAGVQGYGMRSGFLQLVPFLVLCFLVARILRV